MPMQSIPTAVRVRSRSIVPVTWTAAVTTSDGGDWVKLEPASGPVGTCSVTVTAAKNESKDKTRSATVTITAGSETLTYTSSSVISSLST